MSFNLKVNLQLFLAVLASSLGPWVLGRLRPTRAQSASFPLADDRLPTMLRRRRAFPGEQMSLEQDFEVRVMC